MSTVLTYMMQSGSSVEWAGMSWEILAALVLAGWGLWKCIDVRKIKFRGFCDVRKNVRLPEYYFFRIEDRFVLLIENYGSRPVTVWEVAMQIGKKGQHIKGLINEHWLVEGSWLTYRPNLAAKKLPVTIDSGEEQEWEISMDFLARYFVDAAYVKTEKDAKKLRFVAYTSRGRQKTIKLKQAVVDAIIKALHNKTD